MTWAGRWRLVVRVIFIYSLIFIQLVSHLSFAAIPPLPLTIKTELIDLYLRVGYSDTVGIKKISPEELRQSLLTLLPKILKLKSQLETTLQEPDAEPLRILGNIEFYISLIKNYILIHALTESVSSMDIRPLSFEISVGTIKKLLNIDLKEKNELTQKILNTFIDSNSIFSIAPESLKSNTLSNHERITLRFRPESIRSYKLLANASQEIREETYLKLAKYIVINNLYDQLVKISVIKPEISIPPLPELLRKDLGDLADIDVIINKQKEVYRRQRYAWSLTKSLVKSDLLTPNNKLIQEFEAQAKLKFSEDQKNKIKYSETIGASIIFNQMLNSQILFSDELNLDAQIKILRKLLENSKLIAFTQALPPREELEKTEKNITELENFLTQNISKKVQSIPNESIKNWIKQAPQFYSEYNANTSKNSLIILTQELLQKSTELSALSELTKERMGALTIDHHIMKIALQKEIQNLHMRKSALEPWNVILNAQDYQKAQSLYETTMLYFNQLKEKSTVSQEVQIIENDIQSLKKAAKFFGFESYKGYPPSLTQLVQNSSLSSDQANHYIATIKNISLGDPILTITDPETHLPLHEALAKIESKNIDQIIPKVDQALTTLSQKIISAIKKISETRKIEDLTILFAQSSFLHQQFQKSLPMMSSYEQSLTQATIQSLETKTRYDEYSSIISKPMTWFLPLFMFPMLMLPFQSTLLTPANPFIMGVNRLHQAFSPHISGYMLSALTLIFSDLGFQTQDWLESSQEYKDMRDFYQTSLDSDHAFYDYIDVSNAEEKLDKSKATLIESIGTQAFFFGSFFLTTAIRESGVLLIDHWREKQFLKIGFEKNHYRWNKAEIQSTAQMSRERASFDNSRVAEINEAEKSLLSALVRQENRRDHVIRNFESQRTRLGISDVKNPFNYETLENSIQNIRNQYSRHQISERELFLAEEAYSEMITYMQTELSFSLPGPLRKMAYKAKGKIYADIHEPAESIVRQNLFQQVYGFNAIKKDHYATLGLNKDHYSTLGLSENAKGEEIKKAYRKLARQYHPDLNPNLSENDKKIIFEINEAYEILGDPLKRQTYDSLRKKYDSSRGGV